MNSDGLVAAITLLLGLPLYGQQVPVSSLTVCELMNDLTAHRDKIVAVRGEYVFSREVTCLAGEPWCMTKFVTNGFVWPVAIDIKGPSYYLRETGKSAFPVTEGDFKTTEDLVQMSRSLRKGEKLEVTLVGLLRARKEYRVGRNADGALTSGSGFGHLNTFPAQLIVKRVESVRKMAVTGPRHAEEH